MGDPTWGKCPKCSDVSPIASSSFDEGLGAPDKARLWVEVGHDPEYVRRDATFSVFSLTPPRFFASPALDCAKAIVDSTKSELFETGPKICMWNSARVFDVVDHALRRHMKVTVRITMVRASRSGFVMEVMVTRC